jgi:hypothetical protein
VPRQSSPACNQVPPFNKIEAFPLRDPITGNRGIQTTGRVIVRSHARGSWMIGALERSLVR